MQSSGNSHLRPTLSTWQQPIQLQQGKSKCIQDRKSACLPDSAIQVSGKVGIDQLLQNRQKLSPCFFFFFFQGELTAKISVLLSCPKLAQCNLCHKNLQTNHKCLGLRPAGYSTRTSTMKKNKRDSLTIRFTYKMMKQIINVYCVGVL